MTTFQKRQKIVQFLDHLDAVQSERVLGFIQTLLPETVQSLRHQNYKRRALREINQALKRAS